MFLCKMMDWLHSRCNLLDFWPPNSPDLNPIEMIWGYIKARLSEMPIEQKPKTCDELQPVVQRIWEDIKITTINKLIESFYYRLILVATHDGESIQHYYRHDHMNSEDNYQNEVQEFLKHKSESIEILPQDKIIWEKDTSENISEYQY